MCIFCMCSTIRETRMGCRNFMEVKLWMIASCYVVGSSTGAAHFSNHLFSLGRGVRFRNLCSQFLPYPDRDMGVCLQILDTKLLKNAS